MRSVHGSCLSLGCGLSVGHGAAFVLSCAPRQRIGCTLGWPCLLCKGDTSLADASFEIPCLGGADLGAAVAAGTSPTILAAAPMPDAGHGLSITSLQLQQEHRRRSLPKLLHGARPAERLVPSTLACMPSMLQAAGMRGPPSLSPAPPGSTAGGTGHITPALPAFGSALSVNLAPGKDSPFSDSSWNSCLHGRPSSAPLRSGDVSACDSHAEGGGEGGVGSGSCTEGSVARRDVGGGRGAESSGDDGRGAVADVGCGVVSGDGAAANRWGSGREDRGAGGRCGREREQESSVCPSVTSCFGGVALYDAGGVPLTLEQVGEAFMRALLQRRTERGATVEELLLPHGSGGVAAPVALPGRAVCGGGPGGSNGSGGTSVSPRSPLWLSGRGEAALWLKRPRSDVPLQSGLRVVSPGSWVSPDSGTSERPLQGRQGDCVELARGARATPLHPRGSEPRAAPTAAAAPGTAESTSATVAEASSALPATTSTMQGPGGARGAAHTLESASASAEHGRSAVDEHGASGGPAAPLSVGSAEGCCLSGCRTPHAVKPWQRQGQPQGSVPQVAESRHLRACVARLGAALSPVGAGKPPSVGAAEQLPAVRHGGAQGRPADACPQVTPVRCRPSVAPGATYERGGGTGGDDMAAESPVLRAMKALGYIAQDSCSVRGAGPPGPELFVPRPGGSPTWRAGPATSADPRPVLGLSRDAGRPSNCAAEQDAVRSQGAVCRGKDGMRVEAGEVAGAPASGGGSDGGCGRGLDGCGDAGCAGESCPGLREGGGQAAAAAVELDEQGTAGHVHEPGEDAVTGVGEAACMGDTRTMERDHRGAAHVWDIWWSSAGNGVLPVCKHVALEGTRIILVDD